MLLHWQMINFARLIKSIISQEKLYQSFCVLFVCVCISFETEKDFPGWKCEPWGQSRRKLGHEIICLDRTQKWCGLLDRRRCAKQTCLLSTNKMLFFTCFVALILFDCVGSEHSATSTLLLLPFCYIGVLRSVVGSSALLLWIKLLSCGVTVGRVWTGSGRDAAYL